MLPASLLSFHRHLARLKEVKRAGWLRHPQILDVESVADHSWRVAILVMSLPKDTPENRQTCLEYALLHDLAESVVGDITPLDRVSPQQKVTLERQGMQEIVRDLGEEEKTHLLTIWESYERRDNPEARLVKDLDRYEMFHQAIHYEQKYNLDLSEFLSDCPKVTHPVVAQWTA